VSLTLTVLPHPPYSSDLDPSDYTLSDKMKDPSVAVQWKMCKLLCDHWFPNGDNLKSMYVSWCNYPEKLVCSIHQEVTTKIWKWCIDLSACIPDKSQSFLNDSHISWRV
jgi:hypothetical protein